MPEANDLGFANTWHMAKPAPSLPLLSNNSNFMSFTHLLREICLYKLFDDVSLLSRITNLTHKETILPKGILSYVGNMQKITIVDASSQ
jgi:hypothetical protein